MAKTKIHGDVADKSSADPIVQRQYQSSPGADIQTSEQSAAVPSANSIKMLTSGVDTQNRGQTMRTLQRAVGNTRASGMLGLPIQMQSQDSGQAAENRTGMPDHLKAGLEQLSGMDLSGTRVHYNSAKPAQVNALAYTQGQDIHVGPGQEEHLPHEGWHAVQQMQGRVKPTIQAKGVTINDDEGLEHEADVMGVKALQAQRPNSKAVDIVTVTQASFMNDVVQRNIGLEIEVGGGWEALDQNQNLLEDTHDVLVDRPDYELQAELSGKLEFVTKPPGTTSDQQLHDVTKEMSYLADYLSRYPQNIIELSKLNGGNNNRFIRKGYAQYNQPEISNMHGEFQATVGIHLAAMGEFMRRLPEIGARISNMDNIHLNVVETKLKSNADKYGKDYYQISPEMEGLLYLIFYYLHIGDQEKKTPFPKGITEVMARTDFGKMFRMIPEAVHFAARQDQWLQLITDVTSMNMNHQVFRQQFDPRKPSELADPDTPAMYDPNIIQQVSITRRDWLLQMTQGVDRLTKDASHENILKTMGSLHEQTDLVGDWPKLDEAPIIEIRSIEETSKPEGWYMKAMRIAQLINEVNTPNIHSVEIEARQQVRQQVDSNPNNSTLLNIMPHIHYASVKAQASGLALRARKQVEVAVLDQLTKPVDLKGKKPLF